MSRTKEEKEDELLSYLNECLESYNEDGGARSLTISEDGETCTVIMTVCEVEEDDYLGFVGY